MRNAGRRVAERLRAHRSDPATRDRRLRRPGQQRRRRVLRRWPSSRADYECTVAADPSGRRSAARTAARGARPTRRRADRAAAGRRDATRARCSRARSARRHVRDRRAAAAGRALPPSRARARRARARGPRDRHSERHRRADRRGRRRCRARHARRSRSRRPSPGLLLEPGARVRRRAVVRAASASTMRCSPRSRARSRRSTTRRSCGCCRGAADDAESAPPARR